MVVSPFLDRRHGTETCVIEQIERLARRDAWEIHLYSQRVEDVPGVESAGASKEDRPGTILWHEVSKIPGPHLMSYCWWFFANQRQRRRDRKANQAHADPIYSPGINCLDADVVVVHVVFHEFYRRVKSELVFQRTPLEHWPRIIHRKLYYRLIMALERRIYRDCNVRLIAVSQSLANHLATHFGRTDVTVIPNAVDTERFSAAARMVTRAEARRTLGVGENEFVLLLIGNDWKNKGLGALLQGCALLSDLPLRLLVAGSDDPLLFKPLIEELGLQERVHFEPSSPDVMRFYAAADVYVGPSLEDSFGLPILEAMACGLPVIASAYAGASEMIRDGETGLILGDPQNHTQLADLIRRIFVDDALRLRMGRAASEAARADWSWDQNTEMTRRVLEEQASHPR